MRKYKTLLVDGDLALYRAAHSCQHGLKYDNGFVLQYADVDEGKQRIDHDLGRATRAYGTTGVKVALSDPERNWRHEVMPSYKANRWDKKMDPGERSYPLAYWELRDYLKTAYHAVQYPTLEADDLLGIWATGKYKNSGLVLSFDKDLQAVPCHLATSFDSVDVMVITEAEATRTHLIQALMGDRVDGYYGCPDIGAKRAPAIIDAAVDPWAAIVAQYERKGLTEDEALRNARVARILRTEEWDRKKQEVILWTPQTNSIVE